MRARTLWAIAGLALVMAACGKPKKAAIKPSGPPPFPGTYAQSCRGWTRMEGAVLSAECANTLGDYVLSYIQAGKCKGDIGNNNGMLACSGATGSLTPPPPEPAAASDQPASDAPLKR